MTDLAISAHGLTKRFGDVQALAGIDLEVPVGSVFGLLGPNGAGKTTAVRILTTILLPDSGEGSVLGIDVLRNPQAVRERIGLAGQYAAIDENLSGRENLQLIGRLTHLPRAETGPRAAELLETFGLTDAADRLAKTYSGGMRRRLDLAAALVHRPPVLFLDEPTTGLDIVSRSGLWEVIGELTAEGTTVLLTTQYLEEADRLADLLAVIDHGEVIAKGTPAQLKGEFTTLIDIRFASWDEAGRAASALSDAGHSDPLVDEDRLELPVSDGAGALVDVLRVLDRTGLVPAGIQVREPSLDDVFLSLTGHRAEPRTSPNGQTGDTGETGHTGETEVTP